MTMQQEPRWPDFTRRTRSRQHGPGEAPSQMDLQRNRRLQQLQRVLKLKRWSQVLVIVYVGVTMLAAVIFNLIPDSSNFAHMILYTIWLSLSAGLGGFCIWTISELMQESWIEEEQRLHTARGLFICATGAFIILELLMWFKVFDRQPGWLLLFMFITFLLFLCASAILVMVPLKGAKSEIADIEAGVAINKPPKDKPMVC